MAIERVKFVGINDMNSPVFKHTKAKLYYGSLDKLFPWGTLEEEVLKTVTVDDLCYFGSNFDDDPMGSRSGDIEIVTEFIKHG